METPTLTTIFHDWLRRVQYWPYCCTFGLNIVLFDKKPTMFVVCGKKKI